MRVSFRTDDGASAGVPVLVACVRPKRRLGPLAAALDARLGGLLARAIARGRFAAARDQAVELVAPAGFAGRRILAVGLGETATLDGGAWEEIGGRLVERLAAAHEPAAALLLDLPEGAPADAAASAAHLACGAALGAYRFDRFRTVARPEDPGKVERLLIVTPAAAAARRAHAALAPAVAGACLARDLVNEPANLLYPESFLERLRPLAALGVGIEALDERRMRRLGMGALLAVAQGSARPPRLAILRWPGAAAAGAGRRRPAPLGFVGKGVTFDTGGLDIKPAARMEEMKGDMAGAAAVAGLFRALAGRRSPLPAVGLLPLVENMPSGRAYRPGDVVAAYAGFTVEVVDTDAEGRMILADALAYAARVLKPRLLVDLATLTGSVARALGKPFAGLLATDEALARQLIAAGLATGERLWRLPLDPAYEENLKSEIADIRQCAPDSATADGIHAATFLRRFVGAVPWAHLDIAGKELADKARPGQPVGATGFGVRLLDRFAAALEAEED